MTVHEMFASAFRDRVGQRLTRSDIKSVIQTAYPAMPDGSVLPDDHGKGNINPCWCSGTSMQIFETLADHTGKKSYIVRDFPKQEHALHGTGPSAPRFWTTYWKFGNWKANPEIEPVWLSGSDQLTTRGLVSEDFVYVISRDDRGRLLLGGRMKADRIVSREEALKDPRAVRNDKMKELWPAQEWVVGKVGSGTPFRHNRPTSPPVARRLRFASAKRPRLVFDANDRLDVQTARGIRRLTPESAELLDEIIALTDGDSNFSSVGLVDDLYLAEARSRTVGVGAIYPDEVKVELFSVGSAKVVQVNLYERDSKARAECIRHWGCSCAICNIIFSDVYGYRAAGLIHVHHLTPISQLPEGYILNPLTDLRPVCPNCHMVLHLKTPPYSIEEVKRFVNESLCP